MLLRDVYEMWLATYKPKVDDTTFNKTNRFMINHVLIDKLFKDSYVDELSANLNNYKLFILMCNHKIKCLYTRICGT